MHAFVTGGTGLLGHTLVDQLLAEEHDVTALVRSREKAARVLGDRDVEVVVGDMLDVAGFANALDDVDVVFHTAAYFREYYGLGDHWDTLHAVNVEGTLELLAAADAAGVDTVVHVSSEGVVGSGPDGGPGDEETLLAPSATQNLYFRSKILAEHAIDDYLAENDLRVVRVLPGWMFGPGDTGPTASGQLVLNFLHGNLPFVFPGGGPVTDVRDVASAIRTAADVGGSGERYIVAGPHVTLPAVAQTLANLTGFSTPRTLPSPVVAAFSRLSVLYSRVTGAPVLISPDAVATLQHNALVDASKAARELDTTYRPLTETLGDTVAWYVAHGYVDDSVTLEIAPAVRGEADVAG